MKGRETFCCRHTVSITSCSDVKYELKKLNFYLLTLPQKEVRSAGKTICYHVDTFLIPFNLICNKIKFWKVEFRPIDNQGWVGVCQQNIWYHFAALVIYFILTFNMVMFWKSWILTFRHPVLGGESAGKIFPTTSLHLWFLLVCSEKVEFWAFDPIP